MIFLANYSVFGTRRTSTVCLVETKTGPVDSASAQSDYGDDHYVAANVKIAMHPGLSWSIFRANAVVSEVP